MIIKRTTSKKVYWAPIALREGPSPMKRVKAAAQLSVYGLTFYVNRDLIDGNHFKITHAGGSAFSGSYRRMKDACDSLGEQLAKINLASNTKAVENMKVSEMTQEQILLLPEYVRPDKNPKATKRIESIKKCVMPLLESEDWNKIIEPLLDSIICKRGECAGYLSRNPPRGNFEKALWAALQPNYRKVKEGSIGAIMSIGGTAASKPIMFLAEKRWPIWFDKDAEQLHAMGVFP